MPDNRFDSPQVWFFGLAASDPTQPIRMPSLEGEEDGIRTGDGSISAAWRSFSRGLTPLRAPSEFAISLHLSADSVGIDSTAGTLQYDGSVTASAFGRTRTIDVVTFCETAMKVARVYEIPDRPELIAVVSFKGVPGKCDEIDVPVLLVPME